VHSSDFQFLGSYYVAAVVGVSVVARNVIERKTLLRIDRAVGWGAS